MKDIGGYFELELNPGKEYHPDAIKLNLARTAFEYILRAKKVKKVFLPYFTCEVMLEPIIKTGTIYEFYHINMNFEPVFDFSSLKESDYFLYTNYFGLKDKFAEKLANKIRNLIIDNSQAFYSKLRHGIDTFYSPRKFFGVPDGGYLYTNKQLPGNLEIDNSSNRFGHLIGRIENGAEKSYLEFKENDHSLCGQPIKQMSKITKRILESIDYSAVAEIRKSNFQYLHEKLKEQNVLNFDLQSDSVPMVYPFLPEKKYIRKRLIDNNIFVAQYWPNVLEWCNPSQIEHKLASDMLNLPIDQRIEKESLDFILNSILKV